LSIGKKSLCPDQLDAMIGLPVIENSSSGLPNPSPLVIDTIDLTFVNATGASATTTAGTYYLQIVEPDGLPLPASTV
jgi:hypothetical protein